MLRVSYQELIKQLKRVLLKNGFNEEKANLCATLFANANRDGVASHGLNRFPLFIEYIKKGLVISDAEPVNTKSMGNLEQWDGQKGPGATNAHTCMARAIELAKTTGMGLVALRNTNHWMRGGNFGWQAVDEGCIGICWSNTKPNMVAWGTKANILGNNPIIIGIPKEDGHILLDMALSQFSFGKVETHRRNNEALPFIGGYDKNWELTTNAAEIEATGAGVPTGFWKGSGLALVFDLIAAILSGGQSTHEIGKEEGETGLSQVFMAIDPTALTNADFISKTIMDTIDELQAADPMEAGVNASYPGENSLKKRNENMEKGIPVVEEYWNQVLKM